MNRLPKTSSRIGLAAFVSIEVSGALGEALDKRRSNLDVISATQAGSTIVVVVGSVMMAGPLMANPGGIDSRSKTGVDRHSPSKKTPSFARGSGRIDVRLNW